MHNKQKQMAYNSDHIFQVVLIRIIVSHAGLSDRQVSFVKYALILFPIKRMFRYSFVIGFMIPCVVVCNRENNKRFKNMFAMYIIKVSQQTCLNTKQPSI